MTIDELLALGPTCDAQTVAHALGCSPSTIYEQARAGTLPVRSLALGRSRRFLVHGPGGLLAVLGIDPGNGSGPTDGAATRTERNFDGGILLNVSDAR